MGGEYRGKVWGVGGILGVGFGGWIGEFEWVIDFGREASVGDAAQW